MLSRYLIFVLTFPLLADTLTLKSGKSIEGTFLGGDSRELRMAVADRVEIYSISDVAELKFGRTSTRPAAEARPAQRERVQIMRPERETPGPKQTQRAAVSIPEGTNIVIRMIDDVDSERDQLGQTFQANIDESIVVDGETVVPRGADVVVKLIDDKESGKLTGRTELTLDIESIRIVSRLVDVHSAGVTTASESRTGKTTRTVGGGAALGAIIGAIAGGGKGAAIGAVTGAGAGAAVQVLTKGQRVRIPSETRLTFALQQAIRL